jgi:hypothetical protein
MDVKQRVAASLTILHPEGSVHQILLYQLGAWFPAMALLFPSGFYGFLVLYLCDMLNELMPDCFHFDRGVA